MNPFDLTGKNIAITGASSGFGWHFAGVLSKAGASVVLGARREHKLQERVDELRAGGGQAIAVKLDVRDRESVCEFLRAGEQAFGPVDVVVNNAGVGSGRKTFKTAEDSDWETIIGTNLKGPWVVSKAYIELVVEWGRTSGNIVNISSIAAMRAIEGQFVYAIAKAGVKRMTETMALEAAKYGIRVNAIAPGYFLTEMSRPILEGDFGSEFMKSVPMQRFGEVSDLDGPLLLLASDASGYMSGSVLVVDGGHICESL